MQPLKRPGAVEKISRQPIQQLGMRGAISVEAEIAGGSDDSSAEMVVPNPVDNHATHQRICRINEPGRQRGAGTGRQALKYYQSLPLNVRRPGLTLTARPERLLRQEIQGLRAFSKWITSVG